MADYVANFVKTGDPNGAGRQYWPPIGKKNNKFRLFDGKGGGLIGPAQCRLTEWNSFLRDNGPM